MDEIPVDHAQNVDNQADQVIEECLSNPVILSKIMDYIPDTDLLKLSFVNKLWNYEARSVIRRRGNLLAHVHRNVTHADRYYALESDQRQNLEAFGRDLGQMNIAMFSGICIYLPFSFWRDLLKLDRSLTPVLHPTHEAILEKMTIKHLSLCLHGKWFWNEDCSELLLIKAIFNQFSETLETLSLDIESEPEAFLQKIVQSDYLPRLKTLKLKSSYFDKSFQEILVSRAPNLKELHSPKGIYSLGQQLQESSAVVFHTSYLMAPFDEISDNVIDRLRLQEIELYYTGPEFNFERFKTMTPTILQVCCITFLRKVTVDALLAVPLMCYGICLQNVEELIMVIDYHQLELVEPRILRIVKDFDFTRIFPNLSSVTIDGAGHGLEISPDMVSTIIEEANTMLREPMPHLSLNVKKLTLKHAISNVTVKYYSEMFPNIISLDNLDNYFDFEDEDIIPIGSIWKYWKDLTRIELEGSVTGNMDSLFCGIFPEEVAELAQKDDDYLQRVNIVPVMPAITCLKNLEYFRLELGYNQDHKMMLSKVTGLVAFSRCPKLEVRLKSSSEDVDEFVKKFIKDLDNLFEDLF